MKRCSRNKYK